MALTVREIAQISLISANLAIGLLINAFLRRKSNRRDGEQPKRGRRLSCEAAGQGDEERKETLEELSRPLLPDEAGENGGKSTGKKIEEFFDDPFSSRVPSVGAMRVPSTAKSSDEVEPETTLLKGNAIHWTKKSLAILQASAHMLRALYLLLVEKRGVLPTGFVELGGFWCWVYYLAAEEAQHADLARRRGPGANVLIAALALGACLLEVELDPRTWALWDAAYLLALLGLEAWTFTHDVAVKRFATVTVEWAAGLWSFLHFTWVWPLIRAGAARQLSADELPLLVDDDQALATFRRLDLLLEARRRAAEDEGEEAPGLGPRLRLRRQLYRMLGARVALQAATALGSAATTLVGPACLHEVVAYVSEYEEGQGGPSAWLVGCCTVMFLSYTLMAYCDGQMFKLGRRLGVRARAALVQAVYRQALALDMTAADHGQLQNLVSVDVETILNMLVFQQWMWSTFLRLFIAIFLLFYVLGASASAGLVLVFITLPINKRLVKFLKAYQRQLMARKDARMAVVGEAMNGIRVIKLFAWEFRFLDKISLARRAEVAVLRAYLVVMATFMVVVKSSPTLVGFATFVFHTKVFGYRLTSAQGFTAITLFQQLRMPLLMIPDTFNYFVQAKVSLKRIEAFLRRAGDRVVGRAGTCLPEALADMQTGEIFMDGGTYRWRGARPGERPALREARLHVQPGQLVVVYGPTGCGKSSLLLALLGELVEGPSGGRTPGGTTGGAGAKGTVAYCAQQAWIQNATLRDNVLFGRPYDPERYRQVIRACALEADLKVLEAGDLTEIGEKGINLSGGQQQRVALARACYADTDILLLDDVLSAVDAHVGEHLFHKALRGPLLRGKTRVLVTHQVSTTIQHADLLVVLGQDGRVEAQGTFQDLSAGGSAFQDHLLGLASEAAEADARARTTSSLHLSTGGGGGGPRAASGGGGVGPAAAAAAAAATVAAGEGKPRGGGGGAAAGRLIRAEAVARGHVPLATYLYYLRACGGWPFLLGFLGLCALWQGAFFSQNFFLSDWITEMSEGKNEGPAFYTFVYSCVATFAALMIRSIAIAFGSLRASQITHDTMAKRVLFAPMSWFDSTPLGRIYNRFSSDVETIDKELMNDMTGFLDALLAVLGTVFSICVAIPWMSAGLLLITAVCLYLGHLYLLTARQLKRLEAVSKSPLYAHFSETLAGAATVRAYGAEGRFAARNAALVDRVTRVHYHLWCANYWLATRIRILGSLVIGLAGLFIVLFVAEIDDTTAGLVLSFASQYSYSCVFTIRLHAQMEMSVNSIERADEYCSLEQEAPADVREARPRPGWPEAGALEVRDLVLRYPSMQRPVLRGLRFAVPARARVGVVGRTGAGKSSLMAALFRLVEPEAGSIWIDGVDTGKLGLHTLRRRLAIIPQEPVLFQGTVRSNLDPEEERTDADCWEALAQVHLADLVLAAPGRLGLPVAEGGRDLSVGQRQLLCMARALLRRAPVLVMDEATANVDPETDAHIQDTMRQSFRDCTVLCIAHRLHTVIYYDRILVLEQGQVAEYGRPLDLLTQETSNFKSLCERTGDFDNLLAIAKAESEKSIDPKKEILEEETEEDK